MTLLLLASRASCGAAQEDAGLKAQTRIFADELLETGEYFRAATEYRRLLSYFQFTRSERQELRFRVAQCSFRASRFDEAGGLLTVLAAEAESPKLRDDCLLLLAACRMRLSDYAGALEAVREAETAAFSASYRNRFAYLAGLSLLHLDRPQEALGAFSSIPDDDPLGSSSRRLEETSRRAGDLPHFRPFLTGALSALVPGLGQMACGYFWDGLAALAVTGTSLAIGVAGRQRDDPSLAAAGFTLFGVWHAGNIYGGANAARRANRQARERLLATARAQSALSLE